MGRAPGGTCADPGRPGPPRPTRVGLTSDPVESAAAADVATWRDSPARLASLPLGAFDEAPVLEVAARRLLLALRAPVGVVSALAAVSRRRGATSLAESYRYWRAVRRALRDDDAWRRLTQGTTILMYHAVAADGEAASRFVLPPRSFEQQLRWLVRRRPLLGLAELVAHRREHRLPPAGAVVLTFDDGYLDNATVAAPALAARGIPATFFIVTGGMGGRTAWNVPAELDGRRVMSWQDAARLREDGFEVAAHTRTHPNVTRLDSARLDDELSGSRRDIERELNTNAESFAYPYGAWNKTAADGAKRAGFACACTVQPGRNGTRTPLYELRRTEIGGTDSFFRFVCGVTFGDARIVEALVRRLRRRERSA